MLPIDHVDLVATANDVVGRELSDYLVANNVLTKVLSFSILAKSRTLECFSLIFGKSHLKC